MKMNMNINQVWQEFPPAAHYCAGGALCMFLAKHDFPCPTIRAEGFPDHITLASALQYVSPQISWDDAMECARWVIEAHDTGQDTLARTLVETVERKKT